MNLFRVRWHRFSLHTVHAGRDRCRTPRSQGRVREIWQDASVHRAVFCTARIPDRRDPQAAHDQEVFLKAIDEDAHVDTLEMGRYVSRVKYAPLAVRSEDRQPQVVNPSWPVKVSTGSHEHLDDAVFMVSYLHNEEKGSDVNVATHLHEGRL